MPARIPGLEDLTEVGRGGFGTVFAASDRRFARRVAVKVIHNAGVGRDVMARFERECKALGSLSGHPNIVAVHDQGKAESGELYLVMEFLGGGSFAQRLAARGPVSPAEAAVWGGALAGALETAHRSGIVHRDVKPENILFSDYGVPKLVDFGIARMRSAYETRTGLVSATLHHAAPEIVAGAAVSPSADVYSLASALFTMLSGTAPFDRSGEETLAPLIARIATAPPPDLRSLDVPPELATVIERALAKDPEERFESAAAFGFALRDCALAIGLPPVDVPLGDAEEVAEAAAAIAVGTPTPNPTPDPTPNPAGLTVDVSQEEDVVGTEEMPGDVPPRRRRWPIAAAAVALLVLIGASAAAIASYGDDGSPGAEGPSDPSSAAPVELPIATIDTGAGCTGFACRFAVTSPDALPDGAEWIWSIDGVQQPTTGPTLEHTFTAPGKSTVSVAASQGEELGTAATKVVRLESWARRVEAVSTDNASALGTVTVTVSSKKPGCVSGTLQLKVASAGGFEAQGDPRRLPKTGTIELDVDRDKTYQVVLARQDVANGVCERATSPKVDVAPLAVQDVGGTDGGTDGGDDCTSKCNPGPQPNPGRMTPADTTRDR